MVVRTFGTLRFERAGDLSYWTFDPEPHVRIRLKEVFKTIAEYQLGDLRLKIQDTDRIGRLARGILEKTYHV